AAVGQPPARHQPPATARTSSRRSPSASAVVGKAARGTGSPLCSTMTHRPPRRRASSRSSTVAPGGRSTGSPLAVTLTTAVLLLGRLGLGVGLHGLLVLPHLSQRVGAVDVGDREPARAAVGPRGFLPARRPDAEALGQEGDEDAGLLLAESGEL